MGAPCGALLRATTLWRQGSEPDACHLQALSAVASSDPAAAEANATVPSPRPLTAVARMAHMARGVSSLFASLAVQALANAAQARAAAAVSIAHLAQLFPALPASEIANALGKADVQHAADALLIEQVPTWPTRPGPAESPT